MAVIRPYLPQDADAIAELTLAAIRTTALKAYSPEQVAAWAARFSPQRVLDWAARGDTILVAVDANDAPLAYTVLAEGGIVEMLYCHPAHTGKGLAGALLVALETEARATRVPRLTTEASELAWPIFAKAGFERLHRRDFAIAHQGRAVAIHNYAMAKCLG